jgi:heterodisulfide reductase subunit A2
MKIGVYVCHCGRNIAGTVDVAEVTQCSRSFPHVVVARDYRYICSDPGQKMIRDDIASYKLDRVVIASCSPSMHQATFMNNVKKAGLNPYCLERANIREQCSWVHATDRQIATAKAKLLVAAAVSKIQRSQPLIAAELPVIPVALVLGGGISGIQSSLDLAMAGFKVYLVEKKNSLGGHMAQLRKTFPSLENVDALLSAKLVEVQQNPNIEILTGTEIAGVEGYIGNFKVKVRSALKQASQIASEETQEPRNDGGGNTPEGEELKARGQERELSVGTIIVATGYEVFDARLKPEYGYGVYPNVITGFEMERLDEAGGPTQGKILVNGKEPQNIVFIQCIGSRDKSVGVEYCSRVCCMYTAKQALYIKSKLPKAKVTVCYIDVRAFGKGYEQFYERAQGEGVIYRRGVVSEVYKQGDKLIVRGEDTLLGEAYEEKADLVVLAVGLRPGKDTEEIAKKLNIPIGADGFFLEAHPKLGPVETTTDGIYLAGCCQGPKDITDAVAQGHAAAVKACIPLLLGKVQKQPLVAAIDRELCAGCRRCEKICEYKALVFDERKRIMTVNEAICRGCGACAALCPSGANQLKNFSKKQILEMVLELMS